MSLRINVYGTSFIDCSSLADVNECLTGLAMCAHQCLNTRGSFKCTCNPGYELGADGKQCYREYPPVPGGRDGDPCCWKGLCAVLCEQLGLSHSNLLGRASQAGLGLLILLP